jgi:hypothetical protein
MSGAYDVGAIDTLPPAQGPGDGTWKPLRHHFGVTGFGVNAWIAGTEGDEVIAEHTEVEDDVQGHEELYLVTRGYARFTVAGDDVEAPAGTVVFVRDPTVSRRAIAQVRGTTIVTVGQAPGSFEPSQWERRRLG